MPTGNCPALPVTSASMRTMMAKLDLLSLLGRPGTEPAYGAQNYRERKPRGT